MQDLSPRLRNRYRKIEKQASEESMEVHTYTLEKEHQQEHDEYKRLDETKKKENMERP
jgi:hypothetical protein